MKRKLTKKVFMFLTVLAFIATCNAYAASPDAPNLSLTAAGTNVQASWGSVNGATGYMLFYAPYPSATPINNVDMGAELGISVDLPLGSAFYVAVQAYNPEGHSGFSNIEHFELSEQVTPLSVQTVTPAEQEQDVSYYSQITVTFNNTIDSTTANDQNFVVTGYLGTPVSGRLSTNDNVFIFTPHDAFDTDTTITVKINNNIADVNGQILGANFEYSFSTMSSPFTSVGEEESFFWTFLNGLAFNGSCLVSLGYTSESDFYFDSSNALSLTSECPDTPSAIVRDPTYGIDTLVYDGASYWAVGSGNIIEVNTGNLIEIDDGKIDVTNLAFDGNSFWTNAYINGYSVLVELESSSFDILSFNNLPINFTARQNINIAFDGVNFWMSDLGDMYKVSKTGEVICTYTPSEFWSSRSGLTYAQGYLYSVSKDGYLFKYDTNLMEKVCEENRP